MKSKQKIKLLNSMEHIDYSCCGCECEYVLVEDNERNRHILRRIGLTDEEIERDCVLMGGTMDISMVAWERADADWYNGKEKRFSNQESEAGET